MDDENAIRKVLLLYCRGLDRRDAELIRAAYHPDAVDDHGNFVGTGEEFADWVLERLARVPQRTTHVLTNILADVDGEVAHVESYYVGTHVIDETSEVLQFHGRYVDRFERRSGRWAITRRQTVHDWSERRSLSQIHASTETRFVFGKPSGEDPVYWDGALPPGDGPAS
jgi:hypothetical protein